MEFVGPCSNHSTGTSNHLFRMLLQTILAAQCAISPPDLWPVDFGPRVQIAGLGTYDFIVIGAGSAGSVMAARLSENPDWNVLLLEAGTDPPIESEIPVLLTTVEDTAYDWSYRTENSTTGGLGMRNGVFWPRGKMLGGSSALNAMIYVRGNRRDYDRWAESGIFGWDYNSVLPYFKKSEDNGDFRDHRFHGQGGDLKVNYFEDVVPLRQVLRQGVLEMGHRWVDDIHREGNELGFTRLQGTIAQGVRCSAARAFLVPAKDRCNLDVIKNAHVTRLHFAEDHQTQVDGVEFTLGEETMIARTRKEVILSAGALNSPQILMLSGIGPAEHLSALGIPVRSNLAVGQNLQDHLIVPYVMQFHRSTAKLFDPADLLQSLYTYATNRSGFFSTISLTDFGGFVNTRNDSAYPDIQLHVMNAKRQDPAWANILQLFGYRAEIVESMVEGNSVGELVMWWVTLLNPRSRGSVELRSVDPQDPPLFTHNYFDDPKDLADTLRGIREIQRFERTAAFADNDAAVFRPALPACDKLVADSDAYWKCYARHMVTTIYHQVGTTKMGPQADAGAVVDSELRVYGVAGLRVVDAGVMPTIVSGNTNAATIMIGEKAADLVKQSWLE